MSSKGIALFLLLSTAVISIAANKCCECKAFSQSTIYIRPPFQVSSPERLAHFRDDRVERKEDGWLGALQIVPLGGKTTHGSDIASYWGPSPHCKKRLHVNESLTADDTDILANDLNIYTVNGDFSSIISFDFQHDYVGAGFYWQQEFYHTHTGRAIWFSIALPVLRVRNRVTICEENLNNGGGGLPGPTTPVPPTVSCESECDNFSVQSETLPAPRPDTVIAAFNQPGWCYGKINSGHAMTKTGLEDVEIRAALQVANNEHSHMESWAGITIPTGNVRKGFYVFEPIVGFNQHYALFLGSSFGVHVYENDCRSLLIYSEFDFNIQYFASHNEVRSYDLVNRPFSRYMQFYINDAQAALANTTPDASIATTLGTSGINILTSCVKVKPGFARTFNAAWDILWRDFEFEAGYNFYAKQSECVELTEKFTGDAGVRRIGSATDLGGLGTTDPGSLINTNFFTANEGYLYPNFQTITAADINLDSAAAPALLSHTLYASLAYDWNVCNYPVFTSLGGSYEFSPDNTGVSKWMAFAKFGISF